MGGQILWIESLNHGLELIENLCLGLELTEIFLGDQNV
jgi:hypothetical protein